MAFTGAPYGEAFVARVACADGYHERWSVRVLGHGGPAVDVSGGELGVWGRTRPAVAASCVTSGGPAGGSDTGAGPLFAVGASTTRLALRVRRPGLLSPLAGRPDGHVQLVVERGPSADGPFEDDWVGYLLPETLSDESYAALGEVTLTFSDGLGVSQTRRFAGEGAPGVGSDGAVSPGGAFEPAAGNAEAEPLLTGVARVLGPLARSGSLRTLVDWWPWLPSSPVVGSSDPLSQLAAKLGAWVTDDGAGVDEGDALRTIAGRLLARAFQSSGSWWFAQRAALRRAAASGTSSVRSYAYAGGLAGFDLAAPSASAVSVVDAWGWAFAGQPGRDRARPVRSVDVAYRFRPDLAGLVNGSFEDSAPWVPLPDGAASSAEAAVGWSMTGGGAVSGGVTAAVGGTEARRVRLADESPEVFEPTYGDEWAAAFTDDRATFASPVVSQGGYVLLPRQPGAVVEVTGRLHWTPATGANFDRTKQSRPAYLRVQAAPSGSSGPPEGPSARPPVSLFQTEVATTSAVLKGRRARVPIGAFLGAHPTAVDGTAVVPAGTVLSFTGAEGPELTLAKDLVVGVTEAIGDLSEDLASGATARAYYFDDDPVGTGIELLALFQPGGVAKEVDLDLAAFARLPDGRPAYGPLVVRFDGARLATTSGGGSTPVAEAERGAERWVVDRLDFALSVPASAGGSSRSTASEVGATAALPGGAAGTPVALAPVGLGDGPLASSDTALLATDGDGQRVPTAHGTDTGWRTSPYAVGDASSERTVDQLAAEEALRQLAGPTGSGPERLRATFLLRGGQRLRPSDLVRHWSRTALADPAVTTATEVVVTAAPRVGGTLRLVGAGGALVDRTVLAVEPGLTRAVVTVDAPFGVSLARGAALFYDRLFWWDRYDHDRAAGLLAYDGTALDVYAGDVTLLSTLK